MKIGKNEGRRTTPTPVMMTAAWIVWERREEERKKEKREGGRSQRQFKFWLSCAKL
jgi:hypothetical protein